MMATTDRYCAAQSLLQKGLIVIRPVVGGWNGSRKYSYVVLYMSLTFAPIFIECSNSASVVNERTIVEEKGGGSVRQSPVVQMVQPAVVLGACTVHTKVKSDVKHDNCLVTVGRPEEEI